MNNASSNIKLKSAPSDEQQTALLSSAPMSASSSTSSIMLKLKFLPYQIHTFGIRNGLSILRDESINQYERYTTNLLRNIWNVSARACQIYEPYFSSWAHYAKPLLLLAKKMTNAVNAPTKEDANNNVSEMQEIQCNDNTNQVLPILNERNYLFHLEAFHILYKKRKNQQQRKHALADSLSAQAPPPFRGFIMISGLTINNKTNNNLLT